MTNSKLTKRSLLASSISLLLCFTMLLGTTFAWFTDSVTSANNIIKSGNLDVELYYMNDETNTWTKVDADINIFKADTLWEPGHTEVVKLKVVNEGSLALKYQLGVNVASETVSTNVNGAGFLLSNYIKYGIVNADKGYTRDEAVAAVETTANPLGTAYDSGVINLSSGEEKIVTMVVYMPETVGNEANYGKNQVIPTINLGINLAATQLTSEEDSFGSDYDKYAGKTVVTSENAQEAIHAAQPGDIIYLDKGSYSDLIIENADGTPKNGITIEGQGGNGSSCTVSSINLNSSSNITLKNVRFEITGAEAVYKKDGTASGYVSSIIGAKSGAATGAKNIVIDNCSFKTSNSYDTNTYIPISFEEQGRPTSRATNITIRNCKTDPMKNMFNFARLNYMSQGTITIENNSLLATCQHNVFNFTGNAADLIIKDNTIGHNSAFSTYNGWNPTKSAIGTSRQGTNLINIEITGNTFAMKDNLGSEGLVLDVKTNTYTKDNCIVNFSGNTFVGSLAGMTEATAPVVKP